jgi:hypothetical protein
MCRELYELGEVVEDYVERDVAHLTPPARTEPRDPSRLWRGNLP